MYEELVKCLRKESEYADLVAYMHGIRPINPEDATAEIAKNLKELFAKAADAIEDLDNRLNLYRKGKITRPVIENIKLPRTAKCYFFQDEHDAFGNVGVCYGTREKEHCKCGGDFAKCDMPSDNERVRNAYRFTEEI